MKPSKALKGIILRLSQNNSKTFPIMYFLSGLVMSISYAFGNSFLSIVTNEPISSTNLIYQIFASNSK